MTVIAGLVHHGRVHIAGDSAGVAGYDLTIRADTKVWQAGPYAIGFTTSFRMGQLLRYAAHLPSPDTADLHRFMATTWTDAVRTCLKDGGWARKDSEQEQGGQFLVGIAGHLYTVHSDYQIAEALVGYAAVGCGADLALGALHATSSLGMKPRRRLEAALAAADFHSAGVAGPVVRAVAPALT